jgi:hypothetical protein
MKTYDVRDHRTNGEAPTVTAIIQPGAERVPYEPFGARP